MNIDYKFNKLFKKSSVTYFYSSKFFPNNIRKPVSILYAFVRSADNLVDKVPSDIESFNYFKQNYLKTLKGQYVEDQIIKSFHELMIQYNLKSIWVKKFLESMEQDLYKKTYYSINETIDYMYGSAEVVGLMMARILNLSEKSYSTARLMGRAMQYVNFIRDLNEDISLGRQYLPLKEVYAYGLESLEEKHIKNKEINFIKFIRSQINRSLNWYSEAENGYKYIPEELLLPIKTAADMYKWTIQKIYDNPFIVYRKKVKPTIKMIYTYIKN
jgi:phytoene synthase